MYQLQSTRLPAALRAERGDALQAVATTLKRQWGDLDGIAAEASAADTGLRQVAGLLAATIANGTVMQEAMGSKASGAAREAEELGEAATTEGTRQQSAR